MAGSRPGMEEDKERDRDEPFWLGIGVQAKKKEGPACCGALFEIIFPGGVLLSHAVAHAVPSPLEGLTSVFEMGTGVAPPP